MPMTFNVMSRENSMFYFCSICKSISCFLSFLWLYRSFSPLLVSLFYQMCSKNLVFLFVQSTLIIWGEQDKIFPLELAHRLQRYARHIIDMTFFLKETSIGTFLTIIFLKGMNYLKTTGIYRRTLN